MSEDGTAEWRSLLVLRRRAYVRDERENAESWEHGYERPFFPVPPTPRDTPSHLRIPSSRAAPSASPRLRGSTRPCRECGNTPTPSSRPPPSVSAACSRSLPSPVCSPNITPLKVRVSCSALSSQLSALRAVGRASCNVWH